MSAFSEAAQLLQGGAAYARRAGLRRVDGSLVFAGIKPGAFSLYFGDAPAIHADLDGRWQRVYQSDTDTHFLKELDGTVEALKREREGTSLILKRRRLSFVEASDLDAWVRDSAIALLQGMLCEQYQFVAPPTPAHTLSRDEIHDLLERTSRWDADAWFRNREAHEAAYGQARRPFLPPTCAGPIVLQATVEHEPMSLWLSGDERGQNASQVEVHSPDEFVAHCRAVKILLCRRVAQAKGIVLSGATVLARPTERILDWLRAASVHFPWLGDREGKPKRMVELDPERPWLDGVYAFLPSPVRRTSAEWSALRQAGLRHVDLLVVSADEQVRRLHGAQSSCRDVADLIQSLKEASISVGLLVPVGAGGNRHFDQHVSKTAQFIASLSIAHGDLVYLVDMDDAGADIMGSRLRAAGLEALKAEERLNQVRQLRERLMPLRKRKVKFVPYSLQKQ